MANNLPDFATVDELEAFWKPLTASEEERAESLLHLASSYLRQIANNNNVDIDDKINGDPTGVYGENVSMVVMSAVQRSMAAPAEMAPDANSFSQAATPYSESMSFSGSVSTNMYFKQKELALLGLGSVSGRQAVTILRGAR